MMQMPLSSYPHFSQFLQLQQLHQQRYSRTYPAPHPDLVGLSSRRSGGTSCSEASTETPSSSPSPPPSISDNYPSNGIVGQQSSSKSGKSFTIDSILGIRDRDVDKIAGNQIRTNPGNFHPRLGLHFSETRLENYSGSLDLSNATLEIGARIDVARFSASAKDLLRFQLPTDLSSASGDIAASEIGRRNLQNQISTFQNSSSTCRISTDKSPSDVHKKCGGKSKRVRTIFTPEQLERLEAEFERQQYMVGPERLYLAHTLQLTEAQVKVWFQNRRIKWRKQHLEIQQQRLAAIKQQQQNQKNEMDETDDEESIDGNNFSLTGEINVDNVSSGNFEKSVENNAEIDVGQYQKTLPSISQSPSENITEKNA